MHTFTGWPLFIYTKDLVELNSTFYRNTEVDGGSGEHMTPGESSTLWTPGAKEPILKSLDTHGDVLVQCLIKISSQGSHAREFAHQHRDPFQLANVFMGGCNLISLSRVSVKHKIGISYLIVKGRNGPGKLLVITLRSTIGRRQWSLVYVSLPRVCLLITNHELPPRLNFCHSFYLI